MPNLALHGQENVVSPGFYVPNRLSVQVCKNLSYLLQGRLCYLTADSFPLREDVRHYLSGKNIPTYHYDFLHGTPQRARDLIRGFMSAGKSVVFLPGLLAKVRGALTDVPSLILEYVDGMNLPVVPLFLGYYGTSFDTLYRDEPDATCGEEFYVLPRIPVGSSGVGTRLYAAWMNKAEEVFSSQPLLNESLTSHLVRSLRKYGKTEMFDGASGTSLPYHKMLGVAMSLSGHLGKSGEKRIGIILPPGSGGTISLLACMLAGITPVMINYVSSRASFESSVRQAQLKLFISSRRFMEKLPQFAWPEKEQIFFLEDVLKSLPKLGLLLHVCMARFAPAAWICRHFKTEDHRADDEAVLLFTAGSTGEPKGVVLSHRMILSNVAQSCCRLSLDQERVLGSLPLFHSFGLTIALILPLLKGRPICAYPNPTDARSLCKLIEGRKLTMLCATPTFARTMLRRADVYTFASVRYFIVGAERLQPELEKAFLTRCGIQLLEGYGLTEASPVCSVNLPDAPHPHGSAFGIPGLKPRSIGCLLPGIAVRVTDVDDDKKVLPFTERGMLWLKGPNIFRGYINNPELNSSVFRKGWFKTGDIGRMDLNGFVTLEGRISRFSKIGGEMVPHELVENVLADILKCSSQDNIQIAVTAVVDEVKGESLVLLSAIPEHAAPGKELEVLTFLRSELLRRGLPPLWNPRYLVAVPAIPLLPSGKQDLRQCRRLAFEALAVPS